MSKVCSFHVRIFEAMYNHVNVLFSVLLDLTFGISCRLLTGGNTVHAELRFSSGPTWTQKRGRFTQKKVNPPKVSKHLYAHKESQILVFLKKKEKKRWNVCKDKGQPSKFSVRLIVDKLIRWRIIISNVN